jgi:hypothetical protein
MFEGNSIMNDTTVDIKRIQFEMMKKLSTNQRIAFACEMFQTAREIIIASLPPNLSDKEFKQQLYFRTYGEHLPDDFFDKFEKQSD